MTYFAIKASVVVHINDARRSSGKAGLHKRIVLDKVVGVKSAAGSGIVVNEELPANRETENVEAIVIDEVLHLAGTVVAIVLSQRRPSTARVAVSVCVAAEIESGNVDTHEAQVSCASRRAVGCASSGRGWSSGRGCRR